MNWPLPADFVEDPHCTPAALRAAYCQLLTLLAAADPDRHPASVLENLAWHCGRWGLPSPLDEAGRAWARQQLADMPPAGAPQEAGR